MWGYNFTKVMKNHIIFERVKLRIYKFKRRMQIRSQFVKVRQHDKENTDTKVICKYYLDKPTQGKRKLNRYIFSSHQVDVPLPMWSTWTTW